MLKLEDLKKLNFGTPLKEDYKVPGLNATCSLHLVSLSDLKFSPFNDRFAAEITDYERNNKTKLNFDDHSQDKLLDLLRDENPSANSNTQEDILQKGLLNPIVVDERGIVIDGNRRFMTLKNLKEIQEKNPEIIKSSQNFQYTKVAVVIKETLMNEQEIREIETTLNTAQDKPLPYDIINIYLKIEKLLNDYELHHKNEPDKNLKFSVVAKAMGSKYKSSEIKKYHNTFKTMQNYLIFLQNPKYSFLKKRDDHFKVIEKFHTSIKNKKVEINYENFDEEDINHKINKIIYFLTSILYEGKKFRKIFPSSSKKTLLSFASRISELEEFMIEIDLEKYVFGCPSMPLNDIQKKQQLEEKIQELMEFDDNKPIDKLLQKIETNMVNLKSKSNQIDENIKARLIEINIKLLKIITEK